MRSIFIQNIKAATEIHGVKYSQFMNGLALSGSQINRKILSELAQTEPLTMRAIVSLSEQSRKDYATLYGKELAAARLSHEIEFLQEAHPTYEEDVEVTRITEHLSKVFSDLMAKEHDEDVIYQQKLEQEIKDKKIKVTGDPIIV